MCLGGLKRGLIKEVEIAPELTLTQLKADIHNDIILMGSKKILMDGLGSADTIEKTI